MVALVDLPEQNEPDYPTATLPGVAPFSTAKLLELGDNKWNEVADLGEVSMGRPDVLARFIDEAADRYPAASTAWCSPTTAAVSVAVTTTPPTRSRTSPSPGCARGCSPGCGPRASTGSNWSYHDACLMANYETSSALGPLTRYISASEEVTFGTATLSNEAMESLGENVSGAEWGRVNNDQYAAYADQNGQGWGNFTATAVIDGDQMATLDAAVQSFADVASAHMDEIAPEVGRARASALEFVKGVDPGAGAYDLVDLGDFLRHLQDVPAEVAVARDAVFAALDRAVVSQVTRRPPSRRPA